MAGEQSKGEQFEALRQKAEEKLNKADHSNSQSLDPEDVESIKALMHELQVSQTELEVQNEELQNAKEQLQVTENQFEALYESTPVSYVTLNRNGYIVGCNSTAAYNFQTDKSRLINQNLYYFVKQTDRDQLYLHFVSVLQEGSLQHCELEFFPLQVPGKSRDIQQATAFWALLASKASQDQYGEPLIRTVITDITERKQMEDELKQAKQKAEENDALKSAFLANMSHEIRTPLNGIMGFADLLKQQGLTPDEQSQYIYIIQQSGQRLLNTVNDIIELSKIEAGITQVEKTAVNLNHKMTELIQFFQPEARQKGLALYQDDLLPGNQAIINTDEGKLESIMTNLIKNALKYTEEGQVVIGCWDNEGSVTFGVRDTGMGIPEDKQSAIFDRFEQADMADTQVFEGSGLGLSLVKSYVGMLDGTIAVDSEEGQGAAFYVSLPCVAREASERSSGHPEQEASGGSTGKAEAIQQYQPTVLVAEDDDAGYLVIAHILKGLGCSVIRAANGREAVDACDQNPGIDMVLMDLKMPEMDGYEATRRIRAFNEQVYIIAQTAFAMPGDKAVSLRAGINDHITKPIERQALVEGLYGGIQQA